jgi:hypothetical protein
MNFYVPAHFQYICVYASIQNLKKKTYVENLRVGEQIKLKFMLQKRDGEM